MSINTQKTAISCERSCTVYRTLHILVITTYGHHGHWGIHNVPDVIDSIHMGSMSSMILKLSLVVLARFRIIQEKWSGFSSVLCAYCLKKLPEWAPTKTCTVNYRSTTCVGTSTICLRSIKSSLPLRHSRDKLSQALSCFSVLQAAGPGNKANLGVYVRLT